MSNLKLKIPKNIALYCMHSAQVRKSIGTLLLLKHYLPHGYMSIETKFLQSLEDDLGISYKTMQRRIKTLAELGIVTAKSSKTIHFASWLSLRQITDCSATSFYSVNIGIAKLKIDNYLEVLAINECQELCKKAYYSKIQKNDLKSLIIERAFNGTKPLESFTEAVLMAHLTDYIQGRSEYSNYMYEYNRSDAQIGYKRLSELFGYNSWGGMAYKKRKLQNLGLLDVQKRVIEFERAKHTNTEARSTVLGRVMYLTDSGKLQLTLPDSCKIQSQKAILIHLQKNAA